MAKKSKKTEPTSAEIETPEVAAVSKDAGQWGNDFGGGFADLSSLSLNGYGASDTGERVGPYGALQVAACYAAIRAIADDVGRLPLQMFERTEPRGSEIVRNHPIVELLDEPNPWQTREELISALTFSLALDGNAYCWIKRSERGEPIALVPIWPFQMNVLIDQSGSGEIFYRFTCTMYPTDLFAVGSEDMIHVRSSITSPNGVTGLSPIMLGQQVLGIGVATQRSAAVLFANGAQLRGVLTTTGKLSAEAARRMGQSWADAYQSASNAGKTAILEEGTTWAPVNQKSDEAQLLESRKFSVSEIARWFRMQGVKIGDTDDKSFSSLVELNQNYLDDTLMPYLCKFEEAFRRKLFLLRSDRKRFYFKFDERQLLRSKELERFQAYQVGRFTGLLTANECRAMEDMNPIPGGDTFLAPLNMTLTGKPDSTSGMTIDNQPMPNAQPQATDEN